MTLSFKDRIAIENMIATALIIAAVFAIVFFSVKRIIYDNIDHDVSYEAAKHSKEIVFNNDSILFHNKKELEEREHKQAQVNPVFIQIMNLSGILMDKSPNLKEQVLHFNPIIEPGEHFNSKLNDEIIRQVQIPIKENGKIKGYILAAMSMKASISVIHGLKNVLLVSYPLILLGLFFISRYVAGRYIVPLKKITETTKTITQNNLNERVTVPAIKDELFDLSTSINALLDRIQKAFLRERQFTSDASHELRTPLASIQGNLEVLIRKPRESKEYEEEIRFCLSEIDKMSVMVEQLLLMARLQNQAIEYSGEKVLLRNVVDEALAKYEDIIHHKALKIDFRTNMHSTAHFPKYHAGLIVENILNNAIKYSRENTTIKINLIQQNGSTQCVIEDEGIGIKKDDIPLIFNPFYRSDAMQHKDIQGNGVGLPIALKAAQAIGAKLEVESEIDKGTKVIIKFKEILRKA